MEKGFIKLDRNLLNWGWKTDYKMVALWIEILLQANIGDRDYKGEKFERGTFPSSISTLSKNTGLSTQSIRTCLNRLKSTNEITIKSTNKGMKICVVNWEKYQGNSNVVNKQNNKQTNIQVTSNQHATNTQLTTLKERKKERKKEYIYIGEYKNVKLTQDQLEKLKQEIPEYETYIERVSGYVESTGKSYKNYLATIRNWYRRDQEKKTQDIKPIYNTEKNIKLSEKELNELLALKN